MRCGLIGEKLSHSYSVRIHQMLGDYNYELFNLPQHELRPFLERRDYHGLNVTIPYKKAVIPFCDRLDDAARKIGSVNTLVRGDDGLLCGYNTDYYGFLAMSKRTGIRFAGKKVLILGSGGTSLTVSAAAADEGASKIVTVSRNGSDNYENLDLHRDSQIIVNTTPVGMYPDNGDKPIDLSAFPACEGVLDVIYNPLYTRLLLDAKTLGIPHSGGLPMLVAQAKYASELFTGEKIDDQRIDDILDHLTKSLLNIILIGMPGSGKTEIGIMVAARLGREQIDTDTIVIQNAGMSIPEIFEKQGEPAFRQLESEAVDTACKRTGLVISTGGGAVLRPENRMNMKQNGLVLFLDRKLDLLQTDGRPLSKNMEALERMYTERLPIYKAGSDAEITNNDTAAAAVEAILEVYHAYTSY